MRTFQSPYGKAGIGILSAALALGSEKLPAAGQFAGLSVDPASASRGTKVYAASCASCHGPDGRGGQAGPDLIRSKVVLHDRVNSLHGVELGTVLRTGPDHHFDFDKSQLSDLSQFLTQNVNKTLRSGYSNEPTHLLTGDTKAGEAYFRGPGGCTQCHSTSGDLAGIAKRYDPATLQQKFIFPNSGARGSRAAARVKKVQVIVTLPSGKSFGGSLIHIDDFTVALRNDAGIYQSFSRTHGVKVKTIDPYAGHVALLDRYSDNDIHNVTTFLETLK